MKYYVTDKIDGVIDESVCFDTREEAEAAIKRFEAEDKIDGSYSDGFYVIIEE